MRLLNSRIIKIVAIVTMTCDHAGYILFPEIDALRAVGRICMPLICLMIAFGMTKTRSPLKYFLRLFIFAAVMQLVFNGVIEKNVWTFYNWNVFFTLSFGCLACWLLRLAFPHKKEGEIDKRTKKRKNIFYTVAAFGVPAVFAGAWFLPIDYGIAGVFLIVAFYLALRQKHSLLAFKISAPFAVAAFNIILVFVLDAFTLQWYGFLSLPFLLFFSDKKLKIHPFEKYLFYIYYPLHMVLIYYIGVWAGIGAFI